MHVLIWKPIKQNSHTMEWKMKGFRLVIISAVASALQPAAAKTISLQAKSFIANVNLNDPTQFDSANACVDKLKAIAVDCTLWGGEDPQDGKLETGGFRLWSQLTIDADCEADKVKRWSFSPISTAFGKEAFFSTSGDVSKPLSISPMQGGSPTANRVDFSYRVRGQPIPLANLALSAARPRTCTFIWHQVKGSLTCVAGVPTVKATATGSGFPSHRLWIDSKKATEVRQGPFKKLWDCDPSDSTSVQ